MREELGSLKAVLNGLVEKERGKASSEQRPQEKWHCCEAKIREYYHNLIQAYK